MTIYLVQHGQCIDKETDPNRSLSVEGRTTTIQVAKTALDTDIKVATIVHSGKLRAQQTAELFSKYLKASQIKSTKGIGPLDNVIDFVKHFQFSDKMMIVGHLPFMERLAAYLITGNPELTVVKFQNAGIICLDQNEKNNWHIKWTIMPVID